MLQTFLLELQSSRANLQEALAYYRSMRLLRDEVVCLEYLGLTETFAGNYAEARRYFEEILSRDALTASARAQTLRMLTDVYIAEGEFAKAKETARQAEEAITRINERIELGALYRAYGQLAAHDGERQVARERFGQSVDLLREIGARYELALTYLECGRSPVYARAERHDHLRRSRDLFLEMDVPKRLEQVDQVLADLGMDSPPALILPKDQPTKKVPLVIAHSPAMERIIALVDRIKDSAITVLLTGETGSGKDLLALYIHQRSGRKGRFVPVNSAAIPNEMIESELFGYRKGAFTGAAEPKPGLFETADKGTFYLNEIADSTREFQAKLLEVLETQSLRRLGETRRRPLQFRLIAATNQNLRGKMADGSFREDLYYRLQQFPIHLPPLRDRREDVPFLIAHFLSLYGVELNSLGTANKDCCSDGYLCRIAERFGDYPWPGNVRELKDTVARALALWDRSEPATLVDCFRQIDPGTEEKPSPTDHLLTVLAQNNGNRSKTARALGLPLSTLRYQLKKLGF